MFWSKPICPDTQLLVQRNGLHVLWSIGCLNQAHTEEVRALDTACSFQLSSSSVTRRRDVGDRSRQSAPALSPAGAGAVQRDCSQRACTAECARPGPGPGRVGAVPGRAGAAGTATEAAVQRSRSSSHLSSVKDSRLRLWREGRFRAAGGFHSGQSCRERDIG